MQVLGQLGPDLTDCRSVFNTLALILENVNEDAVTRHEAAEALGNFGGDMSVKELKKYEMDEEVVVRETVLLSLAKHSCEDEGTSPKRFLSYDPSLPFPSVSDAMIPDLIKLLGDKNQCLVQRYRALFSLRDLQTQAAEMAIIEALTTGDSALLLHEIAFVIGQLASPLSVNKLCEVTGDASLHGMIRHEAAIALGSIAVGLLSADAKDDPSAMREQILKCLNAHKTDEVRIVADSCEVSLYNYTLEVNFIEV
eukprot:GHVH01000610.1.p3 GENE.GHVH01000610.1~~GHVH01000610.1.p3  ORF type:complete len:253 (+),score=38.83 GHVH01000610.1:1998-2756(+)